jgi:cell division protein FtsN
MLGALLAGVTAWYFTRTSPFQAPPGAATLPSAEQSPRALPGKPGDRPLAKQDFEFYKILPQGTAAAPAPPPAAVVRPERLYLQVGAFENPAEADNMKALLALNGIEASAQRTQLDDGRIVHRVRIGPFGQAEEMNPVRSRLASAGLTASVVRVQP